MEIYQKIDMALKDEKLQGAKSFVVHDHDYSALHSEMEALRLHSFAYFKDTSAFINCNRFSQIAKRAARRFGRKFED